MSSRNISIKSTEIEDLPFLKDLWNDGRVMQAVGFPDGVGETDATVLQWFERRNAQLGFRHFVVVDDQVRRYGEVCFNLVDGMAGLDIKLAAESQGKGIATIALNEVINRAFRHSSSCELVWTEPRVENARARKLYTRCGLREGPRPKDMKRQGKPFWSLHRKEWSATYESAKR
ncbi:MAG: GNAT family N-acetyltransferase [Opitutales bacterium]|nr:GNAT family N-acetyltransferase [Opitutales bacterium]NRA25813.1 GNAT family N-acetyltransferase [Opitutales bacterium]